MSYAGHGTRTQRDSLHVVATSNPQDVDIVVTRWVAVADKARADADVVKTKLAALVQAGGWTGPGADTYARSVQVEVVEPLHRLETSARAMATSLLGVQQKAADATASADASPIPWDSDTSWHVTQKQVDISGYVVGDLVDGTLYVDETATVAQYNAAQTAADYEIRTGSGRVVKTISAASWATTQQHTTPMPPVYHGAVAATVHQFDVWMERQALNTNAHVAVSKAADRVEVSLIDFLATPSTATSPAFVATAATTGLGAGSTDTATMPGAGDSSAYGDGYTPPGTGATSPGSVAGTVAGSSSSSHWMPPGTAAAGQGFSGVDGFTVGSGGAAGGSFGSVAGTASLSFGGASPAAGTAAASAGTGMPGVMPAGVGGMGAPNQKNGKPNLLKVSGLSGTGSGIAGITGNPSFRMGSVGRGTAAAGSVGGVDSNLPLTSLMGGQALMGGRNVRKKDDSSEELEQTWLEEDQDVWGTSGTRIER